MLNSRGLPGRGGVYSRFHCTGSPYFSLYALFDLLQRELFHSPSTTTATVNDVQAISAGVGRGSQPVARFPGRKYDILRLQWLRVPIRAEYCQSSPGVEFCVDRSRVWGINTRLFKVERGRADILMACYVMVGKVSPQHKKLCFPRILWRACIRVLWVCYYCVQRYCVLAGSVWYQVNPFIFLLLWWL